MPRKKASQSKHDAKVRDVANTFKTQGYKVSADVNGFPQPGSISGYRPDVVAQKGNQRKIVEVETPDSVNSTRDKAQHNAFRQAAKKSENTTFTRRIAK